jgi:hypothetical protein
MPYPPPDPHGPTTGHHPLAGWAHRPGIRGDHPDGDDSLVHIAGWILAAIAAVLLATAAAAIGLAAYGLITWRRTRWWPPILLGIALGVVAVATLGGPGPTVHQHLTALRELTGPHAHGLGQLAAHRWPVWVLTQLPLGAPLGLIAAGFARHRVTHQPAHELSPGAKARRAAEDRAQLRRAQRRAGQAPPLYKGMPVLGAWASGDLGDWRAGEWCTIPDGTLGLGTVVLGLPGTGKTETLLRLAQLGLAAGFDVHIIDAKGDPATQTRFRDIAAAAGHEAKLFPQEAYDGWRGDPTALRNRLGRVVDYTEPYYQDGARVAVDHATRQGARSLEQLLAGLADTDLDIEPSVRKGTLSRYRSFSAAAGEHLCGQWAFEDTPASYLLLDGVALGDDTPRLARYLLEDFQHYAATRKEPGRKALLVVDEFSALRVPGAAALLERLRSFGVGVVIASQSVEGLHDDPGERARLLGAASTVIAHRLADPEAVCARAGTVQRAERSHQLDHLGATGMGSLRIQEAYRIDPNDLRNLPAGVAWITTAGRAAKVAVARAGQGRIESSPRAGRRDKRVGPGDPALGRAWAVVDGPEEIAIVEAQLIPTATAADPVGKREMPRRHASVTSVPAFEQPMPPIDDTAAESGGDDKPLSANEAEEASAVPEPTPAPPPGASPYAQGL